MKKRLHSRRGNAMIEFALASGVLIPLFFGTFQFGYTFYVYNLLCTQMRAGARYASLKKYPASQDAAFKTAVKNMIMYGNPNPGNNPTLIQPGLKATEIDVEIKGADGVTNASATVVPATVYVTTVNYSIDAVITKFNFNGKPTVQFPYMGQYAPAE
jgi:Flp pilus assembly protein TadG